MTLRLLNGQRKCFSEDHDEEHLELLLPKDRVRMAGGHDDAVALAQLVIHAVNRDAAHAVEAGDKGVAAGDIITAVNGTRVTSIDELNRVKNQFTAGDSITLTLYNGGSYRDVEVTLIDQATGQ